MKNNLIVFALILLASCQASGPELLTVEGRFTHAAGKKIMLAELPFGSPQRIVADSATLDSSGIFRLTTIQQQEGMYQLFVENGPGILLINDTNQIEVDANVDSLNFYSIKNSKASRSIKSLYEQLTNLEQKAGMATARADSISKTKTPDSVTAPIYAARDKSNKAINDFLKTWLGLEKNATALWYGLGVAAHFLSKEEWTLQLQKAVAMHPSHPGISLMKVSLATAEKQEETGKHLLNKPMPDILLPDTSGKLISLSGFRGSYLLVDFWASWCGPCRKDNPSLLAAYRQFKNKNFTVLGISLDNKKEAWKKAIRADSLSWTQISDLKQWDSKAVEIYGINAIPFNALLDTSGRVIAINLHGEVLKTYLKQLLK